jgi:tagatose 6-phosphate kinase
MILIVTLNPALDVTHHVAGADWAGVNRPHEVAVRPGGKGVNVARTLRALGADVLITGLAGGPAGDAVRDGLAAVGLAADFTTTAGETRRTFAVVDTSRSQTGLFNEPGPRVSATEYAHFRAQYRSALTRSKVVVLSGSLPPGVPAGTYAELIQLAGTAGVPAVLDADGPALMLGTAGRPAIAKPNLAELERAVGRPLRASGSADPDPAAVAGAAHELLTAGAGAVVVSLGAAGLLAVTSAETWQATPPGPAAGNPTGAGDAAVAGLAYSLVRGYGWADRLRHAAALGTAAVAEPVAGDFSPARYHELLSAIRVTRRES